MSDDKNIKTMDINDLVRELSKSSTSPAIPPTPPQATRPIFPTPKPPMSPPVAGPVPTPFMPKPSVPPAPIPYPVPPPQPKPLEVPKPQLSVPPKPAPTPAPTPLSTPGVKEYQSSIRTMNEDISKIKQGQQPSGIAVPRKVEQVVPAPQAIPPKPAMPSQQFKVPSVNLGETKKTASMTPSRDVPGVPLVPKTESKTQIYVPQEGQLGSNRNMLFLGIGAMAVVAGFVYWFFVLRSPAPEVVIESPTPTFTPTSTPIQDLSTIFSNVAIQGVGVKSVDPVSDLINAISSTATEPININGGEFVKLNIISDTKGQVSLGLLDFLLKPKQELIDSFGQDQMVLLYGQKEIFDSKGVIKLNAPMEKRLVFVLEVRDSYSATQTLLAWEATMVEDLQKLFSLNVSKQKNPQFLDNTYSGSSIRYRNFLWPDKSIDYSIVAARNGKSYLVLAGSKESMFATIDKLKGL